MNTISVEITTIVAPGKDTPSLLTWLQDLANQYGLVTILSHHEDGILWGRLDQNGWRFSSDIAGATFDAETLLECRCFGEKAELFLWSDMAGFSSRLLQENDQGKTMEYFDIHQLLWGTQVESQNQDGFILLKEGSMGMFHAPPVNAWPNHRLKLIVRQYLDYDEYDQAYIKLNRLVSIQGGES